MTFKHDNALHNTESAKVILPVLLNWFSPQSIIDIGCGLGQWLKIANELGVYDVLGVNSPDSVKDDFLIEQSKILYLNLESHFIIKRRFDLVLCFEVAEHLDKKSAKNLVKHLTKLGDIVVFSAAIPFQGGDGHKNEQWPQYWINIFLEFGYESYDILRPIIWAESDVRWWYKQNSFVAINRKSSFKYPFLQRYEINKFTNYIHPHLYNKKTKQIEDFFRGKIPLVLSIRIAIKSFLRLIKFLH